MTIISLSGMCQSSTLMVTVVLIGIIRLSKLNQLEQKFNIPSLRRCAPSVDIVRQAVVDEVDKDVAQRNGPAFVTGKLRLKGIMTPR